MCLKKCSPIFIGLIVILLSGCGNTPPKCAIDIFLLDKSLFPVGTYVEPVVSPIPGEPKDSLAQVFYYDPNDIIYYVIRWNSRRSAEREFMSTVSSAFDVDAYMGPWDTPKELVYSSSIADNYHQACGLVHRIYQCRTVATYNEYSTYLKVEISEGGISYSIANKILQAIDEKMAECRTN
jgi:hypothetical protein